MIEHMSKKKDKMMHLNLSFLKKEIISEIKKNEQFIEFMKKNKKAYITFFVVRHRLGCLVLP